MRRLLFSVLLGLSAIPAGAVTRYVNAANPSPAPPYFTWLTAAQSIQVAVDFASPGDVILVTNGVYATGGSIAPGHVLTNRVMLSKAVAVRSVNGPTVTAITGSGPAGSNAVRCAYITNGAELAGFTLANGSTEIGNGPCYTDTSGGGALLDHGGLLSNCYISANSAHFGAGIFSISGRVVNCTLEGNTALAPPGAGGGAYVVAGGLVRDSLIQGNAASYGAGTFCDASASIVGCSVRNNASLQNAGGAFVAGGLMQNCTITSNQAVQRGGGGYCWVSGNVRGTLVTTNAADDGAGFYVDHNGLLQNCTLAGNAAASRAGGVSTWIYGEVEDSIVVANLAPQEANYGFVGATNIFTYSCTQPLAGGAGNIAADPLFVDASAGDYRLQPLSACLDRGVQQGWMSGALDLDGRPRVYVDTVDLGAYEVNPADTNADTDADGMPDWWEWQSFGHVTNTTRAADNDGDRMNAFAEWIAGTDPNSSSSFLAANAGRSGSRFVVSWPSVAGRVYDLYRFTNLMQQASAVLLAADIVPTPPFNVYTDTVVSTRAVIYKLDVRK